MIQKIELLLFLNQIEQNCNIVFDLSGITYFELE